MAELAPPLQMRVTYPDVPAYEQELAVHDFDSLPATATYTSGAFVHAWYSLNMSFYSRVEGDGKVSLGRSQMRLDPKRAAVEYSDLSDNSQRKLYYRILKPTNVKNARGVRKVQLLELEVIRPTQATATDAVMSRIPEK